MNAINNCSFDDVHTAVKYLQLTIYIPTFILGMILNLLALWVFCCSKNKMTETSIYMINLALSDLLLLVSLPFKTHFSWQDNRVSKTFCTFVESLYFINTYASIYIITCISMVRYKAITKPLAGNTARSTKKTVLICGCIWVIVWIGSIPVYDFHNTDNETFRCFHNMSDGSWSAHVIIPLEVFGFLIPLIIMVFCSVHVIKVLLSNEIQETKDEKQTAIHIITANLIVFVVAFTPSHIGIFLQFLVRTHVISDCHARQTINLFIQTALCFANINCCLDAICYYFAAKEFREKAHPSQRLLKHPYFVQSSV